MQGQRLPDNIIRVTRARHVLIVVWAAGGNVVPAAGLAAALTGRGHHVRVLGPPVLRSRFERAGARFRPFERARQPHLVEEEVFDDNLLGWTRFISGRRVAEDVMGELAAERPDVAVVDGFLSAGLAAAEKSAVPTVALVHVLYGPAVEGPLATQWDPTRPLVEATRQHLGLPELDPGAPLMAGLWSRCARVLACAPRSFDVPSTDLPANHRYVGPILDDVAGSGGGPGSGGGTPVRSHPGHRTVLISMSTTDMRQRDVLQRSLDAVADLDASVVCTLGRVPIDGLRPPPNATVVDWLPHSELLPRTDVVVTHAGLSTVMAALASGVPLVCMPMGRDQPLNARRVSALGLGIELPPAAGVGEIRSAVGTVLADASFRQRATVMAEDIASYGNGAVAVREIESLR